MATRVSGDLGLTGQLLISELKRRTPKREGQANFIGLKRDLALSDVEDPSDSLNNVLGKIALTEVGERNQYGRTYNELDWNVTSDFIDESIDKSFLSRLSNVSIGGGSLGSTVSITPRIRIQDRISFLNSFYGEGSYPGLHSGPDAMFYRGPEPKHIGYVKFTFDSVTGAVTVTELKEPNGTTNLSASSILGSEDFIVLDLASYETIENLVISLSGTGISLKLQSPNTWTVFGELDNLIGIRDSVGQSVFGTLRFKLVRPYSFRHKPLWFTQLPGDPIEPGGADDSDLSTTNRIMKNDSGQIKPFVNRGYWYSRAYVETRWTPEESSLLTNNQQSSTIVVEDSNMRWQNPPSQIRSEIYNWGIRWDGYLRIEPGIYAFEVQTNIAVKIDMAVGTGGGWVSVFDTDTAARESEQMYVSGQSFNTDDISSTYKYVFGSDPATDWIGYVPITIRMYKGGPDKINPEDLVPNEPNLFIKTTSLSAEVKFHREQYAITLSGSDGNWTVNTTPSQDLTEIINILQDSDYSVNYRLTEQGDDILSPSVIINLSTDGNNVTSNTTGLSATGYMLTISPNRSGVNFNDNLTSLWKSRIASPSPTHVGYVDLTNGSYEPNLQKTPFDLRPDWWKVSEGHPYDQTDTATDDNTPLDGFLRNSFNPVLKSNVEGLGLYGDGGDPIIYSSKPNIIFGEARYGSQYNLGSNYYGVRLIPNLVGEGGRLNITALPVNNSAYSDATLLGQNDLGGSPNHLTSANGKVSENTIRLFLANVTSTDEKYNKYYTVDIYTNLSSFPATGQSSVTYFDNDTEKYYSWNGSAYVENTTPSSDDPVSFGFPNFSDNAWLSPITCSVVKTGSTFLTAPLVMIVEKLTLTSSPDINFLQFSTTQPSLLTGGADVNLFNGPTLTYYTENNVAFQYLRVDSGEGISFSDVLKLTYNPSNEFNGGESEVPRPPSDRVTPFGFDKPEFTSGLCYPPYSIANTLLSDVAVEDTLLYNSSTSVGNYDVFWGDPTKSSLGGNTLTVTEKLEFQQANDTAVGTPPTGVDLRYDDYTHRLKIDMPLPSGVYDSDMLVHIGNQEKVKESYYAYVKLN